MDAHLRDLRYFVGVAEALSFTRAAERLHISQPALSKQIRGLESTLRTTLFERSHRQVRLTAAGEALLPAARRLLVGWDEAVAAVAAATARERHTLRVGIQTALGHRLYHRISTDFGARMPGWRIELHTFGWEDPTAGLRDRASDAALLWLPVDDDEIEHDVLLAERRFVAMSSEHRLAHRTEVSFGELTGEGFVALPTAAGKLRDFWLGAPEYRADGVRVVQEGRNADEKFEIVSSGAAVTLVAEGNASVYSRPGITCIPVTDLGPARLAVAWRRGERRQPVRAFVHVCIEVARAGAGANVTEHSSRPA